MKPGCLSYFCVALSFLTLGYVLGTSGIASTQVVQAQEEREKKSSFSETVQEKTKAAIEAIDIAKEALEAEDLYKSATTEINVFAITCGGVDALKDLERGTGVDPETFASLYAGKAINEIAEHIGQDDKGRLTYKSKVVRMYPRSRLKKMLEQRDELSGREDGVE
ncbi:hypothetical protein MNBD_PLANCTO02-1100 [hydrothermal vent metagenome]|uniref:Uncharacterized protein n=1 Tax=hydrothermal vent metagenome TaxID=652676 RepID=A0A3B1DJ86_9ZZZZ